MSLIKSFVLAAGLVATVATASAQTIGVPAGTYVADPRHTNVLWSVKHFGLSNYIGRFSDISATLQLDPANPANSKLTAKIDADSVDVNYPAEDKDFDAEIEGPMFFDAAKFGEITFVSKSIELTGQNTGTVEGDLTFHGVTKPMTLNVTLNQAYEAHPMSKKPAVGFSATGVIKRSDFGVNALVGPVSDDVTLTIEAEFAPQA